MDTELEELARRVGESLAARGLILTSAESCTGGWVAKVITDIPGSSTWFDRGFVTYTDEAKRQMLGVGVRTLEEQGAVSEATVCEMSEGALAHSSADVALSISGIAGPGGGSAQKPVGTVCFAWSSRSRGTAVRRKHFRGDREAVRRQSVIYALEKLLEIISATG